MLEASTLQTVPLGTSSPYSGSSPGQGNSFSSAKEGKITLNCRQVLKIGSVLS